MNVVEVMDDAIASEKKKRKALKQYIKAHSVQLSRIASGLEVVSEYIISINLDGVASVDVSVAGDHHVLNGMWAALRKLGYKTSTRPEEKVAGFSGYWYKDEWPAIWMTFSSTKCTRKKIGTKMVEQPVYEVVCE
jgi:hypothetical protein